MLAPLDTLEQLRARLAEHAGEVACCAKSGFASLILGLPEAPATVPAITGPQFQLLHGHREEMRAGYGIAAEWRATGPERLRLLRHQALDLKDRWRQLDPDETGFTAFTLLGFAARPGSPREASQRQAPNALLWLPEAAVCVRRGQAAVILSARLPTTAAELRRRWTALLEKLVPQLDRPAPGPLHRARIERHLDTPDEGDWQRLVGSSLDQIAAGELQKVVLARRLRIESSRRPDITRLIGALGFFFPSCQIVNIRRPGLALVAATPERLLQLRGNRIEIDALAGTASRSPDTARDSALAQALLGSSKNLHEHRLVVQAIRDTIAPSVREV
jgi:isochorismate synthase EntC